jgi:hypothetical protein
MANLYAVAGAKIYIGPQMALTLEDIEADDFAAFSDDWVEIDGWENAGNFGDTATVISTAIINRGRVVKQKGTRDAGTSEQRFAFIPGDPGMAAVTAAMSSQQNYAFRIVWDDAPEGGTPSITYMIAGVSSVGFENGNADTIRMRTVTLMVQQEVIVEAAEAPEEPETP